MAVSAVVLGDLTLIRERHLNFGTLVANSGAHTVPRASESAGFMRIVGDWNKRVLIQLSHRPTELVHTQIPTATLPLSLVVHYTPRGQGTSGSISACEDYQVMAGVSAHTRLRCRPADTAIGTDKAMSYLFFSGTVTVGNVPPGTYRATITVTVEYD